MGKLVLFAAKIYRHLSFFRVHFPVLLEGQLAVGGLHMICQKSWRIGCMIPRYNLQTVRDHATYPSTFFTYLYIAPLWQSSHLLFCSNRSLPLLHIYVFHGVLRIHWLSYVIAKQRILGTLYDANTPILPRRSLKNNRLKRVVLDRSQSPSNIRWVIQLFESILKALETK